MIVDKVISHYRVLEKVGQGGLGEVFLAHDRVLDRHVALKFLYADESPQQRKRLLAEARAAASVDHPYICQVFETGEHEGRPYIVMEYLEGETLAERVRASPVPLREALKIATEIAEALGEAHDRQMAHCDIKPSNIMVLESGHIKILDFGLAQSTRHISGNAWDLDLSSTSEVRIAGTPAYMAPEQARGEKVDPRTDVFAFGIVLFEMLSGVHPFQRPSRETTIAAILHEAPTQLREYVSRIPQPLANVIERALRKKPDNRYPSARELLDDLIRVQNGLPVEAPTRPYPAIAILPFADLSPERDQEYFCDGLAEELIGALGRLDHLRVASRTAAFRYRNADVALEEIGRALHSSSILEGSVRRAGDRLRIVVKLLDVESGYPIWSDTYDRRFDDVFEVQEDVARAIVAKLQVTLADPALERLIPAGPQNLPAYEHYLKGRYHWNRRTPAGLRSAIAEFAQTLEEDPEYALAHAGLADAYVTLALYGVAAPHEVMPRARDESRRALELDPKSPEAWTSLAAVQAVFEWDWSGAERSFESSIQASPRYAQARQWYAINCLCPRGRFEPAKEQLLQAGELEPASLAIATSLGVLQFYARDYDDAVRRFKAVLELDGAFGLAHYFLGQTYACQQMHEQAISELEQAVSLSGNSSETLAMLGHAEAGAGHKEKALDALDKLSERSRETYVSPVLRAQLQIGLKEPEGALQSLEEAVTLRSTDLIWLNVRPAFDPLRADERYQALIRRIGLEIQSSSTCS